MDRKIIKFRQNVGHNNKSVLKIIKQTFTLFFVTLKEVELYEKTGQTRLHKFESKL